MAFTIAKRVFITYYWAPINRPNLQMKLVRNKSEHLLNEAERYQLLVSAIKDYAIYMLDPEGYITSWNAGAQRFKGYTADEIIGQHFSVFLTPEDQAKGIPQKALKTAAEKGEFEAEGWRVRKDGTRFWAHVVVDPIRSTSGELIGFAKITRDVTDKKIAQEALRESEQRFRLLVQGVTDYAIYMLTPEGIISNWNSGAERLKGYTHDEIVGSHFSRFYTEEDKKNDLPKRALKIAAEVGRFENEGWRVRKDGSRFIAHVVIDAIRDEMGTLIGFAKITRDITEKKQAEEALHRANMALFQAQKMDAIGKLTGGIAHDFNNLLSVVSSGLDVLLMQQENTSQSKMLESMQRAVLRGRTLTQQLLSFARQQPLAAEKHDINKLIEGFEGIFRQAGNPSLIRFNMRLADNLKRVLIDAARFESTLLNLVVNARDAMPQGGMITISTEQVSLKANDVGNIREGTYIKICVADTGAGMSKETAARAFEPFYTTKEMGKGTGLGLSQVYGFIMQSGGEVELKSEIGKGTTICLYLPVLTEEEEKSPIATHQKVKDKVLVVDDEADVMLATAELFRSLGYEVVTASRGRDALEILQRRQDIEVLFADVMMTKGMSGIVLARAARQLMPDLKIILSSGYPMPAIQAAHGNIEEFNFISKPYRLSELARQLRS
ncbi:MAG TPA: PAS domain S-box protein [Methylophilaceae bacterium]|nr:PAS domain S-box protein [Methylophilaceae bacterium]